MTYTYDDIDIGYDNQSTFFDGEKTMYGIGGHMKKIGNKEFELEWLSKLLGPTRSISGSSIIYTGGHWQVTDRAGKETYTKGIMTTSGITGSVLNVHLVNDFDATNEKEYIQIPVGANDVKAVVFDEIKEVGTDVSLADIIICLD